MYIHVNGKNIEITDAIKAYVKEKLGKVTTGKHVAEVSCKTNTGVIRCEESAESMYASIDLLADKLDRQVKKFKDKSLYSDKATIRNTEAKEEVEETVES